MLSQPDDGSSDDRRRKPVAPRHQLAEDCLGESDGNDTLEALRDRKAGRGTAWRMGFLSYGITAVALASVVLILERDLVPVSESALSWVTIAGAATMMLIALSRYTRTRSCQSAE